MRCASGEPRPTALSNDDRGAEVVPPKVTFVAGSRSGQSYCARACSGSALTGVTNVSGAIARACGLSEVGADDFATVSRLTDGTGRGVIAVLRQRWTAIERIGAHDLWLAVEGARSSGNLGSLMRTCLAVRARGVIAIGDTDAHDPACVRATMGALEALELARMPAAALAALARASRARLFGATPDGNHDFRDVSYGGPAVIVVGSERRGLSEPLRRACDVLVRIPMVGRIDSLNLAVAGSLILYEAFGHR